MILRSSIPNTDDEIEVVEETGLLAGVTRVRIRERQGAGMAGIQKCSIFLSADELEAFGAECERIARVMRARLAR